ncbi:MAG TPA: CrcB family protein [Ornithinimicrobium sp.]|uniref:CrcB family protein n=1 Tax=Ornithinimicrobium sp. TaxID=1977084 RepID=UPI002B46F69D|nr:CrcB family protein [Ornithinimicrobium sp.]HKJ10780.1 CrcB family protein [Ornithinimicrobium sp.]
MTLSIVLAVAVGGAAGAVLRYLSGLWWGSLRGTFVANTVGCALLGSLVAWAPGDTQAGAPWWYALLTLGLAGALSTWSTLAMQVYDLATRDRGAAVGYLLVTLGAGGLVALVPLLAWGH